MADIFANAATLVTTGSSGTSAPSSGTSENWSVSALSAVWPAVGTPSTMSLIDASAQSEIIRITISTGSGAASVQVTRGADGTIPVTHATGATFTNVAVASYLNSTPVSPPTIAQSTFQPASNSQNASVGCVFGSSPTTGNTLVAFVQAAGAIQLSSTPTGVWTKQCGIVNGDSNNIYIYTHTVSGGETNFYPWVFSGSEYNSVIMAEIASVFAVDQIITSGAGNAAWTPNRPVLAMALLAQNNGSGMTVAGSQWTILRNQTNNFHQALVVYQTGLERTMTVNAATSDITTNFLPVAVINLASA